MFKVTSPGKMNETFARAFNSRDIDCLLALYEPAALLRTDESAETATRRSEIGTKLAELLELPGTMVSENNFYIQHGDLALLRADYELRDNEGAAIMSGSSAEIVRQQIDGAWTYVIDHAAGESLPCIPRRAS